LESGGHRGREGYSDTGHAGSDRRKERKEKKKQTLR